MMLSLISLPVEAGDPGPVQFFCQEVQELYQQEFENRRRGDNQNEEAAIF
jgi:hypothetical protein